ncbi:MAG: hypothetical protein ACI89J_000422, partial [Hyphomicrobiaceae bacterium]
GLPIHSVGCGILASPTGNRKCSVRKGDTYLL